MLNQFLASLKFVCSRLLCASWRCLNKGVKLFMLGIRVIAIRCSCINLVLQIACRLRLASFFLFSPTYFGQSSTECLISLNILFSVIVRHSVFRIISHALFVNISSTREEKESVSLLWIVNCISSCFICLLVSPRGCSDLASI